MMVGGRQAKLAQFEGVVQAESKFKPQKRSSWDEILPWVAPELVIGGRKAEQRSDVYSLNCLIWETVTCKVPWQGLSAKEVEEEVEQREQFCKIRTLGPLLHQKGSPFYNFWVPL